MTNNLKYYTGQFESTPESHTNLSNLIEENKLDMVCSVLYMVEYKISLIFIVHFGYGLDCALPEKIPKIF